MPIAKENWEEYYLKNKEKLNATARAWYKNNLERAKESGKKWRKENQRHMQDVQNEWNRNNPEKAAARNQRRRARKNSVSHEKVIRLEIFERDGWICGLCKKPVDKELRWPDRFSATLDHIIPLAKGGNHTKDNCQLAHFSCNASKCDKLVESLGGGE